MCRISCKVKEDEGRHEDGSGIDPRGDFVINGVKIVEERVAQIDPYPISISKGGGGVSDDYGEGSATGPTRSCGTSSRSCSWAVWRIGTVQASIIVGPGRRGGQHQDQPPPIIGRQRHGMHHSGGPQQHEGVQPPLAGHAHLGDEGNK